MMMSLSVGYPQILASGYPDSKFTIRFSPTYYPKDSTVSFVKQQAIASGYFHL